MEFLRLAQEKGLALRLTWQGRGVLIVPPARQLAWRDLPLGAVLSTDLLVLPAQLAAGRKEDLAAWLNGLHPGFLVLYGGSLRGARHPTPGIPCYYTRQGAVSVYLTATQTRVKQW